MSNEDTRTVELPESVYEGVSERLSVSDFDSVDEYVTFTMREALSQVHQHEDANEFSGEDESVVKDRLDALGYVD
jgi:Arc/MetJ-type ribon-helix-helix transcriptional regulator